MRPQQRKSDNIALRIAQQICQMTARGETVTEEELQFSFKMAELFGDDAVWQQ